MAKRGLDLAERQRLTELAELASSVPPPELLDDSHNDDVGDQALLALYRWYSDWAATARALIKRKDHRIFLGIGERQPRRNGGALNTGTTYGSMPS